MELSISLRSNLLNQSKQIKRQHLNVLAFLLCKGLDSMLKKICNKQGCSSLVNPKDKYCDKHKQQEQVDTYERNKHYDNNVRDKQSTAFYHSREWKTLRDVAYHRDGMLCLDCLNWEIIASADIVDHIVPIKVDWNLRLELRNLRSLCYKCHNKKTWEDKKLYG